VFRVAIVLLSVQEVVCRAEEQQSSERQQRIKALVEALASPNPPAKAEKTAELPRNYNRAAQRRVIDAANALLKEGAVAFPALIAHLNDRRYSCSLNYPNGGENWTVGQMCGEIVDEQLDVYEDVINPLETGGPPRWYLQGVSRKDLRGWAKERAGRTLGQLQIEIAEHALKELKNYRTGKGGEWTPIEDFELVRDQDIKNVERLVQRIKTSGKPVRRESLAPKHAKIVGTQ
jgi:hypothetical protein